MAVSQNTTVPNISATVVGTLTCINTTVSLTGNSIISGVTYSWSGPGIISGTNTATAIANQSGIYTLTVINPTTGCVSTSTVNVINSGVPVASFIPDITEGFSPVTINFTNLSTGAILYNWNFGNGTTSTSTNTANTFTSAGSYTVVLVAINGSCADSATIIITINDGFSVEIPNVFTPNDDNVNDFFTINSKGIKEITWKFRPNRPHLTA